MYGVPSGFLSCSASCVVSAKYFLFIIYLVPETFTGYLVNTEGVHGDPCIATRINIEVFLFWV